MNWLGNLKSRVRLNEPTREHTTLKIGGRTPLWIEAFDIRELVFIVKKLVSKNMNFFIIGNGSNLLISDKDLNYAFIKLKSDYFNKVFVKDDLIVARCGVNIETLLDVAYKDGLGGLEFLSGIPATLGGALYTNAGSQRKYIGNLVEKVKGLTYFGDERIIRKDEMALVYRGSNLNNFIITETHIRLRKKRKEDITRDRKSFLDKKRLTQPLATLNAGCVFKNPPASKLTAAKLIEQAGLKGLSLGGAQVSEKHANFIINKNKAGFNDIYNLIKLVQKKIKMLYNITLETEIKILQQNL